MVHMQTMLEGEFYFYASLKALTLMQTMLENKGTGMPHSMVSQFEVHAPQASVH